MYTRRLFVQSGIALSALLLGLKTHSGRSPRAPGTLEEIFLHLAIMDVRFTAANMFSEVMQGQCVPVAKYSGDITPVWYECLDPVWRRTPVAVGGLTTGGALFCIERLAWCHGMRLIYRGTHSYHSDGDTRHLLQSSVGDATLGRDAIDNSWAWPAQIANLVLQMAKAVPALPLQGRSFSSLTYPSDRPGKGVAGPILTSWLIAPHGYNA